MGSNWTRWCRGSSVLFPFDYEEAGRISQAKRENGKSTTKIALQKSSQSKLPSYGLQYPAPQSPDLENTQLFAIFSGSVACHSSSLWGSQVTCIHFTFQEKKITCDQYWVTYGLNGDRGSYAINSPGLDSSVFSVDRARPDCILEKIYWNIFLIFYLLVAQEPKNRIFRSISPSR